MNENIFSQEVIAFFNKKLHQTAWHKQIVVREKVKILKDFTVGRDRNGRWRLITGFQQQDIVFSCPSFDFNKTDFLSKVMRIDKYNAQKVTIPIAICELKVGSSVNTHAMITYGSIAAHIKQIFPHCAYYFVVDSAQQRRFNPETILRHAKSFDRIFPDWEKEKEKIWQALGDHFSYLTELGVLSNKI
ncbi:MAG: hypothetical protein KC419_02555 [Anaerolineales bacterium]|nr:hypothetical protein [Anaerolineales bacterium]MCA9927323.1 hypothetical protein [Anaerolineales bacterium]